MTDFVPRSVSVEQIQDRGRERENETFASILFPQTENAPLEDAQKTFKGILNECFYINSTCLYDRFLIGGQHLQFFDLI